jgi:hypothetical protein
MGKLSAYAALAQSATADQLLILDTSDTTMSAQGTEKKISVGTLLPYYVIMPTGDTSGANDTAAISAAITTLDAGNVGGTIMLGPGNFYLNASPGNIAVTLPAQTTSGTQGGWPVNLLGCGAATVVSVVGNCTGISCHRTTMYGAQFGLADPTQACSQIRDFILDGQLATSSAIGLDFGDGSGFDIKLRVQNFTGASQIAVNQINRINGGWTEKSDCWLELYNNAQCLVINNTQTAGSGGGSDHSVEYIDYRLTLWLAAGNKGVQILNGSNAGGSRFWFRGNCSSLPVGQTTAGCGFGVFTITGSVPTPTQNDQYSRIYGGHLEGKIEGNDGNGQGGGVYPGFLWTGTSTHNGLLNVTGGILHSVGNSQITSSTITFNGGISGDSTLSSARSTW